MFLRLSAPMSSNKKSMSFLLVVQKFLSGFLVDFEFLPRQIAKIVFNSLLHLSACVFHLLVVQFHHTLLKLDLV